jgi:hypothetical protein
MIRGREGEVWAGWWWLTCVVAGVVGGLLAGLGR